VAKSGRHDAQSTAASREADRSVRLAATKKRSDAEDLASELASLKRENEVMRQRLVAAEARVAELERIRAHVVDRLAWLIDTLGTALDKRP
jgi:predicted  nucleic acid-binding Zn-ribbon protein